MMKRIASVLIIIFFSLILPAYGLPHESELVLDNVWLDTSFPKEGELITINASVYNNGIKSTDFFASIITVAYFVDDELLHLEDLGVVEPGLSNKIYISSPPIWNASLGDHTVRVVVDFHDSLRDEIDSPDDNVLEKTFSIVPSSKTQIYIDAVPQYFIAEKKTPKINISLIDLGSNEFLSHKKIVLYLNDAVLTLFTNNNGMVSFLPDVPFSNPVEIRTHFEGDSKYSSADAVLTLFPFAKTNSSILILSLSDVSDSSISLSDSFKFNIFQDNGEIIFDEVYPTSKNMLDSKTIWFSVPPNHDYYVETYLDEKLYSVSDTKFVTINDVVLMGGFSVLQENHSDFIIPSWIKNNAGWWSDGSIDDSSFLLGIQYLINQKIIRVSDVVSDNSSSSTSFIIPSWIKNNAGWWSDGSIDDSSFVQGIQFLIQKGYLKLSHQ